MRMPGEMEKLLNEQVRNELNAGYVYLSMAAWFETRDLPGCAGWMRAQSKEELSHAMKIFDYITDRGGEVVLHALPEPEREFKSALGAFEAALKHEQEVTKKIDELYSLSVEYGDAPTTVFLQWFVNEQVEEEKSVEDIIAKFKLVREDSSAMLMLDARLGQRE